MRRFILALVLVAGCQTSYQAKVAIPVSLGAAAVGGAVFGVNYESNNATEQVAVVSFGVVVVGLVVAAISAIEAATMD